MTQFQTNTTYGNIFITNADNLYTFKVLTRTEKTITIKDIEGVRKLRISKKYSDYNNAETVLPHGNYSMCMVVNATQEK
jgi:hypothetical protein